MNFQDILGTEEVEEVEIGPTALRGLLALLELQGVMVELGSEVIDEKNDEINRQAKKAEFWKTQARYRAGEAKAARNQRDALSMENNQLRYELASERTVGVMIVVEESNE